MRENRLECYVFRAPTPHPILTSFGAMNDRPAVFLRLFAPDGSWGWGEVFCNFPQSGAEHRARLAETIFPALISELDFSDPPAVRRELEKKTRRVAIQCGEPGPFSQVISAIDQAAWDMVARRRGEPLWKVLAPQSSPFNRRVQVYASGLGPDRVVDHALEKRAEGYRAFKFKVGFGAARDLRNMQDLREALGDDVMIMTDANQAWEPSEAKLRISELEKFHPYWIEEPLAADEPLADWKDLAAASKISLAAGENIRGEANFEAAIASGALGFIQPDVAKWGGISGCREVALAAKKRAVMFCPHWLGGGVGLAASLHLRAALGCEGLAEVDANPNPLREEVFSPPLTRGWVELTDAPGLGVEPDLVLLHKYRVSLR